MTISRVRFGTINVPVEDDEVNPVLGLGALGIDRATGVQKVGDGETRWDDLPGFPLDGGQL
jgi:hypothetical protein